MPRKRFDYIAALAVAQAAHPEANLKPEKVGLQPYVTIEVYERLKAAMREYRTLSDNHKEVKPVEQAILFYAGWLGHYVADGAMPLHVTINYDGWILAANPNGYTTQHGIHSKFESAFVAANIKESGVAPMVTAPRLLTDPFTDYIAYLRQSGTQIERLYHLEKVHGFDGAGTQESRDFTEARLAAGASMLRDMIYTAWVRSADPVPAWHDPTIAPTAGSANTTEVSSRNQSSISLNSVEGTGTSSASFFASCKNAILRSGIRRMRVNKACDWRNKSPRDDCVPLPRP